MQCESCGSANLAKFIAEMGIRSPGLKNIDKPAVWVFPELVGLLELWHCGIRRAGI